MSIRIETKRLILRQFFENDAAAASYNSSRPIVAHYMSDMVMETEEEALDFIRWLNSEKFDTKIPCVLLAIELKSNNSCIGFIGVAPKPEINNEIEILFEIADEYHNNGYATEAGKAMVWWAFEKAGQDLLSAIVKQENTASRRVIEKLGFVYCDTRVLPYDGEDCEFDYFRLYHTDSLPGPEWDDDNLYTPENMDEFFDKRAAIYNDHMFTDYGTNSYSKLGEQIPETREPVSILDIGCGTGIELSYIWEKAPNAHITCVDISSEMLDLLQEQYKDRADLISVIKASYLLWDYPEAAFDIVVSSMTMHHLLQDNKVEVYKKIYRTLKENGIYIESDFIVEELFARQYLLRYEKILRYVSGDASSGEYHIDIPFTIEVQKKLLHDAGFSAVEVPEQDLKLQGSWALLKAVKRPVLP